MNRRESNKCVYIPASMLEELRAEAKRLDRSMAWVVKRAWLMSRASIAKLDSVPVE